MVCFWAYLSRAAIREGNGKCCVSRGRGDYNELGSLLAELMKLGLERSAWVGPVDRKGRHLRREASISRGRVGTWAMFRQRQADQPGCTGWLTWRSPGRHPRKWDEGRRENTRPQGAALTLRQYGTPSGPELFKKINGDGWNGSGKWPNL